MKYLKIISSLLFLIGLSFSSHSQREYRTMNSPLSNLDRLKNRDLTYIIGKESNTELVLEKSHMIDGVLHKKYCQTYKGIEVFNSQYFHHTNGGDFNHAYGNIVENIRISITPALDENEVQGIVKAEIAREKNNAQTDDLIFMSSKLAIYHEADFDSHKLVYVFDVKDKSRATRQVYICDANHGSIIDNYSNTCNVSVPGKGQTTFYGEQHFLVDSISENFYHLIDRERNIRTYTDINNTPELIYHDNIDFILPEDFGGSAAIDVHYGASKVHDYLLDKFNFKGLDGNGHPMINFVQGDGGNDYTNASWDGDIVTYGSGDCNAFPTTSIDVVAHEFMHAVTEFSSDLNGLSESRGINEGISDIFGKAIEYHFHEETFDWILGSRLPRNEKWKGIRNMKNPWEFYNPKYFEGLYYGNGSHNIGSVFGHWFYLLSEGGEVTNEVGDTYNINAVGIENAMNIVFMTTTEYLGSRTRYLDLVEFTKLATEELFGKSSGELEAVMTAWDVVGLGADQLDDKYFDLSIQASLPEGNLYCKGAEEKMPVDILISNLGDSTILPGTEISFRITLADPQNYSELFNIIVEDSLFRNDKILLNIDEGPSLEDSNFDNVVATILLEDEDSENNIHRARFDKLDDLKFDVELRSTWLRSGYCNEDSLRFLISLKNKTCEKIEVGEEFLIRVSNSEDVLQDLEIRTDRSIVANDIFSVRIDIPAILEPDEISFSLISEIDEDVDNNLDTESITVSHVQKTELFIAFDDNADYKDVLSTDFGMEVVSFEGESMFGITGRRDEPDTLLCIENDEIFKSDRIRFISICLDLEGWEQPEVSFDLIQLRNTLISVSDPLYESQNMLKLTWVSSENDGEETIVLDPNVKEKIEVELPGNFNGELKFSFFLNTGNFGNLMNGDFSTYDFAFIDNLLIEDKLNSSASESASFEKVTLYPNPVKDILEVHSQQNINMISIYSTSGQRILGSSDSVNTFDTSSLTKGIYLCEVVNDEGTVTYLKFVKI